MLHLGAGPVIKSQKKLDHKLSSLQTILKQALNAFNGDTDWQAEKCLVNAISSIENLGIANAGVGANLTLDARVELEASFGDVSAGKWGSVAAAEYRNDSTLESPVVLG